MGKESEQRKGFEAVYQEHYEVLYKFVFSYVHDRDDTEDILQDTFLRYLIHNRLEPVKYPRAWMAKTAKNLAVNHLKHANHEMFFDDLDGYETELENEQGLDLEKSFFENMWRREMIGYADTVLEAVRIRNKRWYEALVRAYGMEMPRQQVADEMGVTLHSLASMLQRAKQWIEKYYRNEYEHIIGKTM